MNKNKQKGKNTENRKLMPERHTVTSMQRVELKEKLKRRSKR